MKFSSSLILGAFAAFAAAAPTPEPEQNVNGTLVPYDSVIGGLAIPDDVYPVFTYENNTATVVFLNATVLAETKKANAGASLDESSLARREAEAEADAGFHWVTLKIGQPFFKRDAEADAGFHWVTLKIGQPFFKRSAEAFKWVAMNLRKPHFKRDAEADAEAGFHWVTLKIGQPFF